MLKNKIIVRVVVFLGVLLFLFAIVNLVTKPIWLEWNNYNTTHAFYEEPENTIETIFLGASITVNGIIPMELYEEEGICAYNLGTELQPMLASYYWLEEAYRLHSKTLKTVIVDTSMLRYTPEDSAYRKALENMRFSKVKYRAIKEYAVNFNDMISYLIPIFAYHERWKNLNDADFTEFNFKYPKYTRGYNFITNKLVETTSGYQQIPVPSYKIDSEEKGELSEISLKYLYRMISFCEEHEIKLVLMKTPVIGSWTSDDHNAIQDIAQKYNLAFLDFNYEPYIDEIGFNNATDTIDGLHMNYSGAHKLTQWLGNYLIQECQNTDVRGQEKYQFLEDELADYKRNCISVELEQQTGVRKYLSELLSKNDYTIFITVKDDAASSLSKRQKEGFTSKGLNELAKLTLRDSYLAVIENGTIVTEQVIKQEEDQSENGAEPLTYTGHLPDGTAYTLTSGGLYTGNISSCVIGGTEYSMDQRGLNIVVYDQKLQKVVDSTYFDTCASAVRESPNPEQALADAAAQGKSYTELSATAQQLYLYNQACADKKLVTAVNESIGESGLISYLQTFWGQEQYVILLSGCGDVASALNDGARTIFRQMGLMKLARLDADDSYAAAIYAGEVLQEKSGDAGAEVIVKGVGYRLTSVQTETDKEGSIFVDNQEYADTTDGLHVAVYNVQTKAVIDSRTFRAGEITPLLPGE